MKPRTKRQRQFVGMAERLPVISDADKAWIVGQFKPQVRLVNLPHAGHAYHCQCCGKVIEYPGRIAEIDKCLPWRCPECGKVCEVVVDRGPRTMSRYTTIETEKYFTKIDVFEGVQVFRQIVASRRNVYGKPTEWEFPEVWQNWVLADGSEVITSRPYTRGVSFFNWYDQGEIGIGVHNHHCSGYYEFRDVYDCYGHHILPKPHYMGLLRRNGYQGWITKMSINVAEAAKAVLSDHFAEELAKVGIDEDKLFDYLKGKIRGARYEDYESLFIDFCKKNNGPCSWNMSSIRHDSGMGKYGRLSVSASGMGTRSRMPGCGSTMWMIWTNWEKTSITRCMSAPAISGRRTPGRIG